MGSCRRQATDVVSVIESIMSDKVSMRTAAKLFKWEHGYASERIHLGRLVCEMVPQFMGETWRQF